MSTTSPHTTHQPTTDKPAPLTQSATHTTGDKNTTANAATATAEAQLAKSNEQRQDILAQQVEREKWMPTPTQDENDRAAMGEAVLEKKPDGSPVELTAEQQAEAQKKHRQQQSESTRHMEARKPEGASYQTRSAARTE
jgi:hypothetical protein